LHRTADTAGAVIGPLAGLCLYEWLDQRLRPLFWVAVAPAVISVAPVGAVRDPRAAALVDTALIGTARADTWPAEGTRSPWRVLPRRYLADPHSTR
jgi:hypothetical protein